MPIAAFEKWLKVVSNLRVDRKGSIAPHKPLLLLVLAELTEEGKLLNRTLPLTGELVFRFLAYGTVVAERRSQRLDIYPPFFHMRSDGYWTPLDEKGQPTLERRRAVAAQLDTTFLACLNDADFRNQMRRILIAKYFIDPGERVALYQLVGLSVPPDPIVKEDARLYETSRERGREARFRLTVVPAYNYTCALSQYRLVTVDSGSIVDAAHIISSPIARTTTLVTELRCVRMPTGCSTRAFGHWTMSIVSLWLQSGSMNLARRRYFCHSR
jgi:putative restriction endonuclease